jgi:hypothetical protein
MGFNFDFDKSNGQLEISGQGWIYLACTIPLTFVVLGLSFTVDVVDWYKGTEAARFTPPKRYSPALLVPRTLVPDLERSPFDKKYIMVVRPVF